MFDVSTFGIREWMLLVGGIVFLLIVLDGIRRVLLKDDDEVVLSKHAKRGFEDGVAMDAKDAADAARLRYELPSKPRVVTRGADEQADDDTDIPDDVPVLNDTVEKQLNFDELIKMASSPEPLNQKDDLEAFLGVPTESVNSSDEDLEEQTTLDASAEDESTTAEPSQHAHEEDVLLNSDEIDDVVAIYVRSNNGGGFNGQALFQCMNDLELRFGSMDIFHRRSDASTSRNVLYSVANAVEPGTFDLAHASNFETPCVVFFMQLPGPERAINAFREMLDAADRFAKALDGTLLDEQRNLLHQQSLVHIHEKLQEYERKQLLNKKRDTR